MTITPYNLHPRWCIWRGPAGNAPPFFLKIYLFSLKTAENFTDTHDSAPFPFQTLYPPLSLSYFSHFTGVILTSRLRDCDLTSPTRGVARPTTASSSVLLSPPGSPSSCGRPGSASGSDLSPPARYYHHHHHYPHHRLRGGDDMDEEGMEDEDEEDGELGEEEDQHDLTQFADWF